MIEYLSGMKPIQAVKLRRNFMQRSIAVDIRQVLLGVEPDYPPAIVIDITALKSLRYSEVSALFEYAPAAHINCAFGVICNKVIARQLRQDGFDKIGFIFESLADLYEHSVFSKFSLHGVKAIVLAGQNRPLLGPLQDYGPTPLLPIGAQSALMQNLQYLQSFGITDIMVHLAKDAPQIRDAIQSNKHLKPGISLQQNGNYMGLKWAYAPMGTAQAIAQCYARGFGWSGDAIIVDATTVHQVNYAALVRHHRHKNAGITLTRSGFGDQRAVGVAVLRDQMVPFITGSGDTNLTLGSLQWSQMFKTKVQMFDAQTPMQDTGTPQGYFDACVQNFTAQSWGNGGKIIHPSAKIAKGCDIRGPVFIGEGANVEAGAYLRGPCIVAKGARIGAGSYVQSSYVLPQAHVPPRAWASHMFIGPNWALDYRHANQLPLNTAPLDQQMTNNARPVDQGAGQHIA